MGHSQSRWFLCFIGFWKLELCEAMKLAEAVFFCLSHINIQGLILEIEVDMSSHILNINN